MSSSMEKKFYDQAIDSDVKRYEEIRKIKKRTTWRLIAVDLSRQRELDVDPKTIQEIEFIR